MYCCIYRALIGNEFEESEATKFAEADYLSDVAAYGPLTQEAFFDVLLELIDTWAENAGQFFRSAFAWALFDWWVVVLLALFVCAHTFTLLCCSGLLCYAVLLFISCSVLFCFVLL